jgi:magnesium transporter
MGIVIGGLVFILSYYVLHIQLLLVSIVSVSIFLNIVTATLLGVCLPIGFRKLNIDPAVASAPFISTTLDIVGQIIYFVLTVSVISWLL